MNTKFTRRLLAVAALFALPFLLVWFSAIMTAFSFNPRDVFGEGMFWGFSGLYWILATCLAPLVIESVD